MHIKKFWIKSRGFSRTTSRSNWWWVKLANFIISFLTITIFLRTFGFIIYEIISILPQIAINIRKLRDFGKNWKWIFINLFPILG